MLLAKFIINYIKSKPTGHQTLLDFVSVDTGITIVILGICYYFVAITAVSVSELEQWLELCIVGILFVVTQFCMVSGLVTMTVRSILVFKVSFSFDYEME